MPGATTKKKSTTTTKSSTKLTKKDEDIIKKKLKKLLEKEGVKSKPKASTSKSTGGCCGSSCGRSKSPSCSSGACYFEEKSKNKTTKTSAAAKPKPKAATTKKSTASSSTAAKKTSDAKKKTAASSSKEYSCANGVCTLKPKAKPKPKAKSSCEDGSCFFLKKNTNTANKTNPKKVSSAKKTAPAKPKAVPAKNPKVSKKPAISKSAKTAPKSKAKTKATAVKKAPIRSSCSPCGDCFSSSDDYSDEEEEFSEEDESSYTDESDFDDSDSDDDFDCGGGSCGLGKRGSSNKCNDSFESGSWETDSESDSYDCSSGQCGWNVRKRDNFTEDDDEDTVDENINEKVDHNETALVPVNRSSYIEESETDGFESESSYSEESFEEESEEETEEDASYEDSEYSPSDSVFESDDDYQLPDSEAEDVIVRRGEAKLYPLHTDEEIYFDSDASSLQVIEITEKTNSENTNQSDKMPPEQKLESEGSDEGPQQFRIEENDSNDSDDSCPQLVPINEGDEFNVPEIFYSSESDYEMEEQEEKDVPKMKAHIFVGTPNSSKTDEHETSINALFRNCGESLQRDDVSDYMSPLDKIASKSVDLNTSKYKVITPKSSKRKIELVDSVLEPAEKKIHISEVVSVNEIADHQVSNSINESNSDSLESKDNLSPVSNSELEIAGQITNSSQPEVGVEKESSFSSTPEISSRFYNSANSRYVLLLLKSRLFLYGTVKMKLIAGEVKVFGYTPKLGETTEIFSPRGYSALYIEPSVRKRNVVEGKNLIEELSTYSKDFLSNDLKEITELFDDSTDALVLLERNDQNKTIEMLRKYMEENLFPNMNLVGLDRPFYASEFILRCLFSPDHQNELIINPHWDLIECTSQSKMMIIGGKSVGKSTLVRYLINRNVSKFKKILLIDLDIGQPEVFIPQTVSATLIKSPLIGPGYLKGFLAEKSYLFGDINVVLSPIAYLKNVRRLLNWCHQNEELKDIPWIVNTMGYCKGFGSELISVISEILDPTDIIQIQSPKEFNNFDYIMTPDVVKTLPRNIFSAEEKVESYEPKHKLILLNTSVTRKGRSNEADFSSRDNRFAIVISRIGTILTGHSEWLSDVKPVCASIDDINIICFSEDKLDKHDLLQVANLNLVYLCGKSDDDLECYGLGIVRGVDRFQGKIYLLPAVPVQVLQHVNTLAICNITLPTSIILNQGPKIKGVAPYTYNTNDGVLSKHITQIYHRQKHFFQSHRRPVHS